MSEPTTDRATGSLCPACSAPLTGGAGPDGAVRCPSCGRCFPGDALAELARLSSWSAWADERARWLRARMAAGDLPADGWSALGGPSAVALPGTAAPAPPQAGPPLARPAAGSLLLAGGAVLLVLAGIAFVAFAWDLLGPAGQVLTLYGTGAAVMAAGVRLRLRLPGTATTLAVVGALLVVVSTVALRVLGPDLVGRTTAWLVTVAVAIVLTGIGARLRRRMPGAGETTALAGAGLTAALVATGPVDDALPLADPWAWWPAVTLLVGGVVLLVTADRVGVRSWPPLATVCLFLGALVLGGFVGDVVSAGDTVVVVFAGVTLACAVAFAALARLLPGRSVAAAAASVGTTAVAVLTASAVAVAAPDLRPWAALVLAGAAGLVGWARGQVAAGIRPATLALALWLAGAALGAAVAPWSPTFDAWQGLAAGAAFAALLSVLPMLDRAVHPPGWRGVGPVGGAAAGVWLWSTAVLGDQPAHPGPVLLGVATLLLATAATGWVQVARRVLPAWAAWAAALAATLGSVSLLARAELPDPLAPEWLGVALAWGPAVAGALCWWVRRPTPTATMLSVAPALTLLLAPTVVAMADDATSRWWWGTSPGTAYQVRVVALFVVGAALVVLGASRRWAGVLVPAAASLVAVTAVQLVELGRFLPQWVSFAVAGALLVLAGARWESVLRLGRAGGTWVRALR